MAEQIEIFKRHSQDRNLKQITIVQLFRCRFTSPSIHTLSCGRLQTFFPRVSILIAVGLPPSGILNISCVSCSFASFGYRKPQLCLDVCLPPAGIDTHSCVAVYVISLRCRYHQLCLALDLPSSGVDNISSIWL